MNFELWIIFYAIALIFIWSILDVSRSFMGGTGAEIFFSETDMYKDNDHYEPIYHS